MIVIGGRADATSRYDLGASAAVEEGFVYDLTLCGWELVQLRSKDGVQGLDARVGRLVEVRPRRRWPQCGVEAAAQVADSDREYRRTLPQHEVPPLCREEWDREHERTARYEANAEQPEGAGRV